MLTPLRRTTSAMSLLALVAYAGSPKMMRVVANEFVVHRPNEFHAVIREGREVGRFDVLFHLCRPFRPGNSTRDFGKHENPSQGHLGKRPITAECLNSLQALVEIETRECLPR